MLTYIEDALNRIRNMGVKMCLARAIQIGATRKDGQPRMTLIRNYCCSPLRVSLIREMSISTSCFRWTGALEW